MVSFSDIERAIDNWSTTRSQAIASLGSIATEANNVNRSCQISQVTASAAGIVGGALIVAGFFFPPLLVPGIAGTAAAGVTSAGTSFTGMAIFKSLANKAKETMDDEQKKLANALETIHDFLEGNGKISSNGFISDLVYANLVKASGAILKETANVPGNVKRMIEVADPLIETANLNVMNKVNVGFGLFSDIMNLIINSIELSQDQQHALAVKVREAAVALEKEMTGVNDAFDKVRQSRNLSAGCSGRRSLKSVHGTYLRALAGDWRVDMVPAPARAWENWHIVDWGGKVVLRAIHSPSRYLRAHPDCRVDLADKPQAWEEWTPSKNADGSWSFLSEHGGWLSLRQDGSVATVHKCQAWEHVWLEGW